jgi:hypothetical protein
MANEEKILCPHCQRKTAPGNFCQRCAKPLDASAEDAGRDPSAMETQAAGTRDSSPPYPPLPAPPAADSADLRERLAQAERAITAHTTATPPPAAAAAPRAPAAYAATARTPGLTPAVQPAAVRPVPPAAPVMPASGPSSAHDLVEIQYNRARAFVVNLEFPLQFRIRAIHHDIEQLVICFRGKTDSCVLPADEEVHFYTQALQSCDFPLRPKRAGQISIQIYLGVRLRQEPEWVWHRAMVSHLIYPEPTSALQGLQTLTIDQRKEIKIDGQADRAGDNRIHVDASNGAHELLPGNHNAEIQRLIDTLAAKEDFYPLPMHPAGKGPIPPPQLAAAAIPPPPPLARVDRLTLERGGRALHLCSKETITYGRKREHNDLVVRCYQAHGAVNKVQSCYISAYHGEIGFDETGAWLSDHPFDPEKKARRQSTHGTALDNQPIPPGGKIALRPGQNLRIQIATHAPGGAALTLTGEVSGCPRHTMCPINQECHAGLAAGILLRRTDSSPEDYALVWRCLPLENAFTDLPGARVYRHHDAFLLLIPGHAPIWLYPGATIPAPRGSLHVTAFQQKLPLNDAQQK